MEHQKIYFNCFPRISSFTIDSKKFVKEYSTFSQLNISRMFPDSKILTLSGPGGGRGAQRPG